MGSRREEERNEKIIRGLMKLPPNRRCINCNSLGPQYVCTNFWTFVCMTCSGIHREFTHRVKSVSMSKFTSQEVEALQNGGNQRAREIYLKDWDQQRQRLPDNSNVDKVREFIKNVYVDKKYAEGKTADKPPRDLQRLGSHEDETRRASSYHSYSQSPPYDFQYEDRLYGKQATVLTRKPGSDRGLYPGKMSSIICSPTRMNDRVLEDRFANEGSVGSVSRFSDYSVSSGGDPIRSGTESPNFQKETGFSSPPVQPLRGIVPKNAYHHKVNSSSDANFKRDSDVIPRTQRTASLGSIGSLDSNSMSLKSYDSGSLVDIVSGPDQAAQVHQDTVASFPVASTSANHDGLDLFKAPGLPESGSSATSHIDLFQLSATSPAISVDLFQAPPLNPATSMNLNHSSQTSLFSSLDLFSMTAQQQPAVTVDNKSTETSVSKDEGWATFDIPQHSVSTPGIENVTPSPVHSSVGSVNLDKVSSLNTSTQWPAFQNSGGQMSSSISGSDIWHGNLPNVQAAANATGGQTWNAFNNLVTHLPAEGMKQFGEPQLYTYEPLSTADQYMGLRVSEGSSKDGIQREASHGGFPDPSERSDFMMGPSYTPTMHPLMQGETESHPSDHRSTNPFDLPYESDLEPGNMFLDTSSLQSALPNAHMPSTFIGTVPQPWFSQDPLSTYLPAAPQGGLAYMAGQSPNPQLANVHTQGPVASVGGNPFA